MTREYIIKVDYTKTDIMGGIPLEERPKELIRCKDCKHRPIKNLELEQILEFPDSVCPCQNTDDDHYSWYPADDWYCADGERR